MMMARAHAAMIDMVDMKQQTAMQILIRHDSSLIDPHTHRAIPICPPHPLPVRELLTLPHLDPLLALLESLLARLPRRLPMRRRHGDEDALLADGHEAQTVRHGDGGERVFAQEGGGDGEHGLQGEWRVGCVGEVGDGFAVE